MNILEEFAQRHKIQYQGGLTEGEETIPGDRGEICVWSPEEKTLAAYIKSNWGHARAKLKDAGCEIVQSGDFEGLVKFDPTNDDQSNKAIFLVRCYGISEDKPKPKILPNTAENSLAAPAIKIHLPIRPVKASASREPIFEHKGGPIQTATEAPGWYFWNETFSNYCGPYPDREKAEAGLKRYCTEFLGV